jgi:excisionase family DNA binding protein
VIARPADDPLFAPADAAEYLSVGVSTVYRLIETGAIEVVRLPGRGTRGLPRIRRSTLNALAAKSTRQATA